ncbi:hypothetical protein GGR51DRAFT_248888 [Nemania sp. FL0031]|nr:hypothetical protein GGR51DRAFT_248888 [Nemania sp. FL0031]
MCTGIAHVYRCPQCQAVVYKLKEAARGYTCYQARKNRRRGICRTGIDYSYYDRPAEELCLYCEIFDEIRDITAEVCDEGSEPWLEDREDDIDDDDDGGVSLNLEEEESEEEDEEKDQDYESDEDEKDEDEGGAKVR